MKLCHGQGYDGAGAMSGAFNGCQAHFIREVPQATYYHCSSHQLNLALSKACTVNEILRMVDSLKAAGLIFNYSPKRQRMLETCIDRANEKRRKEKQKEIKRKKLKLLCETRWVERHTALEDFHELYEPIMNCLARIATPQVVEDEPGGIKWDTKSSTEAAGLLNVLQSSELLIAFYTCNTSLRTPRMLRECCSEKAKTFWQPTWIFAQPLQASVMLAMMLQVAFLVFSNLLSSPPTCLVNKSRYLANVVARRKGATIQQRMR